MSQPTILVVDDIPENVELLEAYLIPENYHVITAYNGIEALERARETPPDIVLLDVMMPQMDGFEVCQTLKNDPNTQFVPVVMVTALKERDDKLRGIEVGADDFLTKPIDRVELLTRIKSLIRVKFLHDDLEKSYVELQELQNVKERLTQMIVHDLKNPLTGVKANIEIVGMDDLGETRECLDAAQRSCDLLFNMIQDLLDISKMEEGKLVLTRETLDLVEIVSPAVREASVPAQAEDKEVVFELPEDLARVNVDRDFIYRTLSNLMQNAIKHSGRGGIITVSASNTEDKMRVQVKDTGQGIPADFQEKIFEKFGQVETRQRTGSGLGLTFCKMAIEAHDGKIWVESVEGEGSTFIFEVPLKPPVSA
ncbi:MAG: two-component system sensor histidine kinase/response regulator [Candidatus Latescibacterota bacterium]|jgi:two-component system sensor histidine kinase/response regulator